MLPAVLRAALADAWALVAPVDCVGCGAHDRALCPVCATALRPVMRQALLAVQSARPAVASLTVPVVAALDYAGVVRDALLAFKGDGRTELARPLAGALRRAVEHAWPASGADALVPVPGSRAGAARRGFAPTAVLVRRAGLVAVPGLVARDHGPEQKRLGLSQRLDGTHPRFVARARLHGARVMLVDDVVTSGATLRAATRALAEVGAEVVGAAALAATPRRHGVSSIPWRLIVADEKCLGDNVGPEG